MSNLNGILMITFGMACFALEDLFIKTLSTGLSVGQILLILGVFNALIFLSISIYGRHRPFARAAWQPLYVLRASCEGFGAVFFATALARIDLSVVSAVFQALPLVITMGAALFLGEQVGWRRWSAILLGFLGVLIIIRPGVSGFQPEALLVLVAVFAIAARDLITRCIDSTVSSMVVSFQGFLALIPAGLLLMWINGSSPTPLAQGLALQATGAVIFGALGYYGIVTAMRIADVGAVMPFRYSRLLFSIILGVAVLGERPDIYVLMGSMLVLGTGLYTFMREQRLAKAR